MLISNKEKQIFIPRESLTAITVEFASPLGMYDVNRDKEIALRMEGGIRRIVQVTVLGQGVRFFERYLSMEDAVSDVRAMERCCSEGGNVYVMNDDPAKRKEYERYCEEYRRVYASLKNGAKAAYSERLKGEIK